jgi:4-amino-4-deoxy-L-arabinose transferase-like glycosyltransferase
MMSSQSQTPFASGRDPFWQEAPPVHVGRSIAASLGSRIPRYDSAAALLTFCFVAVAGLAVLRGVFAATIDLRVDEAYYWTWSKESVVSYLDHPPMIAWCIRFGTLLFGDTNFGVRFPGLVAMFLMQLLLADIVWRTLRDVRYVVIAVLLPEASLDYGLLMARVAPDVLLIPLELAMIWSLVRLSQSGNHRWWLAAGLFGGLALLTKYTAILLLPAVIAFAIVPDWRKRQLSSPQPWLAAGLAFLIFSPVLYWNAVHEGASFRFQLDRPAQIAGWSARFLADFVGQQFVLVGVLLLPIVLIATWMLASRGYRSRAPLSILLSTAVIFPLGFLVWHGLASRIGDSWPLFVWPLAFVGAIINLKQWRQQAPASLLAQFAPAIIGVAIVSGTAFVAATQLYYIGGTANYLKNNDPIGKEAGFADVVAAAEQNRLDAGATWFATTDYRIYAMLRWHLRDAVPVVQVNERSRYIGFKPSTLDGHVGLYVAPRENPNATLWEKTDATLLPVGEADLVWRGFRYDTYTFQELVDWKPVLAPPEDDEFYIASPS